MKKLLAIIICVVTVLSLGVLGGCSKEVKVNFKLSEDGSYYSVSGVSGNRNKLSSYEIPSSYSEDGVTFLPVTEIGERAFYNCYYLSSVTIPDSVTKIDNYAFTFCALREVIVPDSVTKIGVSAFANCEELREIIIPESVQTLSMKAFSGCSKLENVIIKAPITEILISTFSNMYAAETTAYTHTSLQKVYLPATIERINRFAFEGDVYIREIYFEGTEEQWNNIKFYGYEENSSGQPEEIKSSFGETFVSNPHVNFNSNYKSDY